MRILSALLAFALAAGGVLASASTASAADGTRLALAMPLTVPPQSSGLIPPEQLELYTSPTGILTEKLAAVEGQPVAIGLDPMIIASIRILGNTAPESAIAWLERLAEAPNEVFPLSYADADVSALSQAGSTTVLGPTAFQIDPERYPATEPEEPTASPTPGQTPRPVEPVVPTTETLTDWDYTVDNLLWPRQNTVTAADLTSFNAARPVTTILSSGNVTASPGASAIAGEHGVLVADETLSSLLARAVSSVAVPDWQAAMDELASELQSRPGSETLLATFPRGNPQTEFRLAATISALASLTAVTFPGIAAALDEPQSGVRVADIPVDSERVSRMRLMLAAEALVVPFADILADPTVLTGERRLSMLALASNSWVEPGTVWAATVDEWLAKSNAIVTSVQIAESSTLNFFQDKGNLPISVSNDLEYPVTVYVSVRSATGILVVVNSRVPIEVPAGSQARASIPVQSIANGQASLQVSLSSGTNVAIGSPKTVTANVVAGWETTATWVIAALLVVMFIAGIVRTVLKRRRAADAERASTGEGNE